jgi:hypothetical protein
MSNGPQKNLSVHFIGVTSATKPRFCSGLSAPAGRVRIYKEVSMGSIQKKEVVATSVVLLFVSFFSMASLYELVDSNYSIFDIFRISGVSIVLLRLAFTPKMLFVPFREAFAPELPTIIISRKIASLLDWLGPAILLIGFVGGWIV